MEAQNHTGQCFDSMQFCNRLRHGGMSCDLIHPPDHGDSVDGHDRHEPLGEDPHQDISAFPPTLGHIDLGVRLSADQHIYSVDHLL